MSEGFSSMSAYYSSRAGSTTSIPFSFIFIILFSFILVPFSRKSVSAFTLKSPEVSPQHSVIQNKVMTLLQLWQAVVAWRFSSLRKLGEGKIFCLYLPLQN